MRDPVFTGTLQVAVVVPDLDAAMKTYVEGYGIGPWDVYEFHPGERPCAGRTPAQIRLDPHAHCPAGTTSGVRPRDLWGQTPGAGSRIGAMPLTQGDVLWTPPADARERFVLGRYLTWLGAERGLDFAGYDELWRWSVDRPRGLLVVDLGLLRDPRARAVRARARARASMPGAEWFPGARLNYAEHMVGRDEDVDTVAIVARSQSREPFELTFGELREQVARARAGLQRLGVGPGDRVVAYLPNIPETLVAFLATASLGAIWATCPPEFGARSVLDRLGQLEPKVLLAVAGYRYGDKLVDRREQVAAVREGLPTLRGRRPRPVRGRRGRRAAGRGRAGTTSSPSPGRSSSTRCRSRTRSTSSSPPARPACRRRSCTGTAASSSST